jgi:hypothetical protein
MATNLVILAPDTPDFNRLFLHVYSVFHEEIATLDHESRMRLFVTLKSIIFDYIPAIYPEYYANYPDSLNKIYDLVDETISKQRASA